MILSNIFRKQEHIMQKYFDNIVKDIQKIVSFPSVQAPAEKDAPFGRPAAECLDYFLSLARNMGFETHDYDHYVGEVIFGEGEEFAVLAHLDVVPAGNGWKYPPFGGVIENGKLYGRGTMDDKGPAIVCLYALHALKEEGFRPKRKIKLIVGCNEETGWGCMEHYRKVAHMPEEGFTPDADFPVIYAEKGIVHLRLAFPLPSAPFKTLSGGSAANMVCDRAESLSLSPIDLGSAYEKVKDVTLSEKDGVLVAQGVSAHGSTPEAGANALQGILAYYAAQDKECAKIFSLLFKDRLNLKEMHDETGHLTFSPDVAEYKNGVLYVTTDFRYPATHTLNEVTHAWDQANVSYEILHEQAPLYNPADGKVIQTLLNVYNRVTGKNEKPIAIGGGTYARVLKCGCGFGPQSEDEEVTIHQPNEYIALDKIRELSEIYYLALKEISK